MARFRLYPATGQTALDESGGIIPERGSVVTITPYYEGLMQRGLLQRQNPLSPGGTPVSITQRAYALTPEMFGAVGGGVVDDSTAVQAALNYIRDSGGGTLVCSRVYSVSNMKVYSNTIIEGGGWDTGFSKPTTSDTHSYCLSINPGSDGSSDPADNIKNVVLRNISITGTVSSAGFSQFQHLLNFHACSSVLIEGCRIKGFRGDGIYLGSSNAGGLERHNEDVTIRKCLFDGVNNDNRNAISIIDGTRVLIEDNRFENCTRADQPGPIDLEPNGGDLFARIRAITIRGNRFKSCIGNVALIGMVMGATQASLTTPMHGLVIDDNFFESSNTGPTAIAVIQIQNASASTVSQEVVISRNKAEGGSFRAYNIGGIRGLRMLNNDWSELGGGALFGAAASYRNYDMVIGPGERFFHCAKTSADALVFYDNTKVKIVELILDSCGFANGTQGRACVFAGGSSTDDFDMRGLRVVPGTRTLSGVVKEASHTFSNTANNRKLGWQLGGLGSDFVARATGEELIAQTTVNVPSIADGASYTSSGVSVPGAAFYDAVRVSGSQDLKGCQLSAYVSAADTVKFTLVNNTGSAQDLDNMDYTMWVIKS